MPASVPSEPWHSFLNDVDALLHREVLLHCLGGFVIAQIYALPRPTVDVDTLVIVPGEESKNLISNAGKGSELHRKYKVYLDLVTVADAPENYEARLTEMFVGAYQHLHLFALDPYDLALAKLGRNSERDREDVLRLARKTPFELDLLKQRYEEELRPYIANQQRNDLTVELWMEMIAEDRGQ